jgi:hypothetical protein
MNDSYNQWHQQPTSNSHMISNQNYQMPAAATTLTTSQQTTTSYLANADQLGMMYSHGQDNSSLLPQQISPQVNVTANNYMGQQGGVVVQGVSTDPTTTTSTSDESDDLNDPNVSYIIGGHFFLIFPNSIT